MEHYVVWLWDSLLFILGQGHRWIGELNATLLARTVPKDTTTSGKYIIYDNSSTDDCPESRWIKIFDA